MTHWFKRNGIHLAIIAGFAVLCFIYFSPVIQGKVLPQYDVQQARGMQREIMDFKAKDGVAPLWTNAMFGGMPAYQIWAQYPKNITTWVISFFTHIFPNPVHLVFLYLIGAYLLFCSLKVNRWLAAAGAIAFAFTSYNFVLIEAGHSNQALAIAFFAPVVAGVLLTFRRDYWMGGALTAFALAVEIRSNHVQMTYYLFIAMLVYVIFELVHALRSKTTRDFLKSLLFLAVAALVAIAVNAGSLWTTYEYSRLSQRGKSNLSADIKEHGSGLDKEYAYSWSMGVDETITFLIPDAFGGKSAKQLGAGSAVEKTLMEKGVPAEQAAGFAKQLPVYWGDKSFTAGPIYFGALVVFLFIAGLFIVNGRIKWWILATTALCVLLSFGRHFPYVSDIFFNYFPLYNNFRTVESILAIVGFLVPLLAILAVQELGFGKQDPKLLQKKMLWALYISGGLALLVLAVPTLLFDFKGANHESLIQSLTQVTGGDAAFATTIARALVEDRIGLARADALRSLLFILAGAAIAWALIWRKLKPELAFILFGIAILTDLWTLDRRYLNKDNFVENEQLTAQFQPREVDQLIKRDPSQNYRVLDLTAGDIWATATPTYFHNTVGGYHPAKLKRFQEVISKQFNGAMNEDVLDMLNTKYLITASQQTQPGQQPTLTIQNRATTCGNAWLVPAIEFVKGADQEMTAINSFDPKRIAFVDESFKPALDAARLRPPGPNDRIELTSYHPDHLTYDYSAGSDVFAVFSEIWYDKGWNAYVDGKKISYVRANYILRGAQLPGGNHKLEFRFEPVSYYAGEWISLVASVVLVLAVAFASVKAIRQKQAGAA